MNLDEQIIESYLNGDENAIAVLVNRYAGHIYNFVRQSVRDSEVAEDLTQEVFVKAWKNIKKFDLDKKFKPWLFQIARNAIIDYLRKKKDVSFSELEDVYDKDFDVVDDSSDIEGLVDKKAAENKVKEAIEKIPEKYRSVISLYYQEGFNLREISEISGKPLDTVKSQHRRALQWLKKLLSI